MYVSFSHFRQKGEVGKGLCWEGGGWVPKVHLCFPIFQTYRKHIQFGPAGVDESSKCMEVI